MTKAEIKKPIKPREPNKPKKMIPNTIIKIVDQEVFGIDDFKNFAKENQCNVKEVILHVDLDCCDYDPSLCLQFKINKMIENSNYDKEIAKYYNKLQTYTRKLKKYNEEIKLWREWKKNEKQREQAAQEERDRLEFERLKKKFGDDK